MQVEAEPAAVLYARFTGAAQCTLATVAGGSGGNEHSIGGVHGPGGGGAGGRMVLQSTSGTCATSVSNGIGGIVFAGVGGNRGSGPSASSDPVSSGGTESTSGGFTPPTASVTVTDKWRQRQQHHARDHGNRDSCATIRVTIDGVYVGSALADGGGNWTYTPRRFAASHTLTVTPVYTGAAGTALLRSRLWSTPPLQS